MVITMIVPDYYKEFKCIGGECHHNCCCGGWEIEIDDDSVERFNAIDGEFGARVREAIDNDNVFIRSSGHCPLLDEDGLCAMVKHGYELCTVCDEYPRFTEKYDEYTERGISLSCEAAADIILSRTERMTLEGESGWSDDPMLDFLYTARNNIFALLQMRELDIYTRIRLALSYGQQLQQQINNNDYSDRDYEPEDRGYEPRSCAPVFDSLLAGEKLSIDWDGMLRKARDTVTERPVLDDISGEQIAVYFVYRYFLKAFFDCDALAKLKLMAVSVIAVAALENVFGDLAECARRYSIETEHSEENIDMLYDDFLFNSDLSFEAIMGMLS